MTLPKNVEDAYALSPMQRLMLLHAISSAGNGVLLNHVGYDIRGPLGAPAFQRAWEALVARHPALRTAVLWERLPQPLQVVRSAVTLPFRHLDLTDAAPDVRQRTVDALRREDAETPMPLGKAPLMRCTLVRLGAEHHYFMWAVHHLVVDRWSHAVMFADLRALYSACATGAAAALAPAASFRSYVEWIARQDPAAAERFWEHELAGAREPTLLAGDGRQAHLGARVTTRRALSRDALARMRERAALWRTTPGAMVLAAVALTMAARTRRDDVLCGVTVSGRPPDLPDAETIVGSFVNNLPARIMVQRERPVDDWLRDVQRAQARRQDFAHVSLADIHAASALPSGRPLFDTLVLLNLTSESDMPWPGIDLIADAATLDAGYPLLLSVTVEANGLVLTLVHDAAFTAPQQLLAEVDACIARLSSAEPGTRVGALLQSAPDGRRDVPAGVPAAGAIRDASRADTPTIADALLHAWRDVLAIDDLGLDDDFFALGGTSLQAAQLFARVERITGRTLPLSTLFGAGSVRALLAAIEQPLPRSGALVRLRSSGMDAPIYAIPGIGGNVVGLAALARALGRDQPFYAFESPGLDGREPPLQSIDAIAERYANEIVREDEQPFHLLALCWGAAVVAELARKLGALGRRPTSLTLIDPTTILRESAAPPSHAEAGFLRSRLELYWDEFREGDWRDRTRMLAGKAMRAAKVLAGGETRKQSQGELVQFRVTEANKNAIVRYLPTRLEARARIFITPYRGDGDDPRLEWLTLIDPTPSVVPVRGVNAGDAIAPANAAGLARALRAWLGTASGDTESAADARAAAGGGG